MHPLKESCEPEVGYEDEQSFHKLPTNKNANIANFILPSLPQVPYILLDF